MASHDRRAKPSYWGAVGEHQAYTHAYKHLCSRPNTHVQASTQETVFIVNTSLPHAMNYKQVPTSPCLYVYTYMCVCAHVYVCVLICPQIALWSMQGLISDAEPRPAVQTTIPTGDVQFAVRFNMNNINELISNGKRRVYFWQSQYPSSGRFKYYSPPLRSKDFKQSVGDFVMSVFVPGNMQALTATEDGDLVVWDEQGITAQMGTRATDRRAIKLMRIHQQV